MFLVDDRYIQLSMSLAPASFVQYWYFLRQAD